MNKYRVYENYRDNVSLRNKFYDFVRTVYPGADFEIWYRKGFWLDNYVPFSIIMDDKVVSNVSITRMNIIIDGSEVSGIQFGTVGTIPEYRKRGLSRYLMEYVLDKVEKSADFLFLFANQDVVNFYTRFGFDRYSEVIFKSQANIPKADYSARKLDINSVQDFAIIRRLVSQRVILTRLFGARDYGFITFWHILNVFHDNLYYLEDHDVILIVSEKNGCLHIWDVIHSEPFGVKSAISKVIKGDKSKSISYYFSPDQLHFEYDSAEEDIDSPLFVRGPFPISGKHFKFPTTAQT
jgi:GNAT superfamily N-acetyltransferase